MDGTLLASEDLTPDSYFAELPLEVIAGRKSIGAVLPPHSVAIMRIKLK